MDLRIVNTCNNDCLYCLEQSYRKKEKFVKKDEVFDKIKENIWNKVINFYWWNPLLHPYLEEIIDFAKKSWFESIWLITNTYWLDENKLSKLKYLGLSSIWFYFNSFNKEVHKKIVNWWILYDDFIKNFLLISKSKIYKKVIIHINTLNISNISWDLKILNDKFWFNNFEFINYFPFDRPYDEYKNILEYDIFDKKNDFKKIFLTIKDLNLNVKFYKFSKDFFWDFLEFYDYENWVLKQIWDEDIERINKLKIPLCFEEKRCKSCFIIDNCKVHV